MKDDKQTVGATKKTAWCVARMLELRIGLRISANNRKRSIACFSAMRIFQLQNFNVSKAQVPNRLFIMAWACVAAWKQKSSIE